MYSRRRNDWFFSRSDDYDESKASPFSDLISSANGKLEVQPWLQKAKGRINPMYAMDKDSMHARTTFPSIKMYRNHFLSALLYERAYCGELIERQFNVEAKYPALVQKVGEHRDTGERQIDQ